MKNAQKPKRLQNTCEHINYKFKLNSTNQNVDDKTAKKKSFYLCSAPEVQQILRACENVKVYANTSHKLLSKYA